MTPETQNGGLSCLPELRPTIAYVHNNTVDSQGGGGDSLLFWYRLGLKLICGHAHKTRSWYLLGVTLKKSDELPRHFYMGVPPPGVDFDCSKYISLSVVSIVSF